jgi:hypothetical protein
LGVHTGLCMTSFKLPIHVIDNTEYTFISSAFPDKYGLLVILVIFVAIPVFLAYRNTHSAQPKKIQNQYARKSIVFADLFKGRSIQKDPLVRSEFRKRVDGKLAKCPNNVVEKQDIFSGDNTPGVCTTKTHKLPDEQIALKSKSSKTEKTTGIPIHPIPEKTPPSIQTRVEKVDQANLFLLCEDEPACAPLSVNSENHNTSFYTPYYLCK